MRSLKILIVTVLSLAAFVSCKKDKSASLTLERTSLYFASWSDSAQEISYTTSNAKSVAVASYSDGWNAVVNGAKQTITVWPVGATDGKSNDELPKEGAIVVNVLNKEGSATSYYISVYISSSKELDEAGRANCYVITKPCFNYTFDATHRPDGAELDTKSVSLLWQSNTGVVKNVGFFDGMASFYVQPSANDDSLVENTNAVIAAYDAAGDIVWSWHLWIVNDNPLAATEIYSNGKSFMQMNLGAFTNANGSHEEQKILDSYGMFYQWGRKDPFPRPYFFDASGADIEGCYNELGGYVSEEPVERTSSTGTVRYTIENPMVFITTANDLDVEGGSFDWHHSTDNELWVDGEKSTYDPCPYGWRVPTAEDLSVLFLADAEDNTNLNTARGQYGWPLSDGSSTHFYSACGRRRYNDGKIENMNHKDGVYPSQPQPWEGYYWTSTADDSGKAVSLYFDLTTTRTINKFDNHYLARRANGFQVRCVKE